MTVLRILDYPDPKLKRIAKKVNKVDDSIKKIIADMFETHYAQHNCAALAATQLDINDPPHITVIDFSENKDQPLCIINGNIIAKSGSQKEYEGCMSVYPEYGLGSSVKRFEFITVEYLDQEGNKQSMDANGFMAKCIQHELDHLDGKIYLDHLSKLKRAMIDKKVDRIIKHQDKK